MVAFHSPWQPSQSCSSADNRRIPLIGLQQQASLSQLIYALLSPVKLWCIPARHVQILHHGNTGSLPRKQLFKKYYCCISSSSPCHSTTPSSRYEPRQITPTPALHIPSGSLACSLGKFLIRKQKKGPEEGNDTRVSKHPSPSCNRETC